MLTNLREPVRFDGIIPGSLTLLEGLPHPAWEKALLEGELERPDIVRVADCPFYKDPMELRRETVRELEQLVTDPRCFATWGGEKRCGGFHPDYALVWNESHTVSNVLLCFGCDEALLVTQGRRRRVDVELMDRFRRALTNYRVHRPTRLPPAGPAGTA